MSLHRAEQIVDAIAAALDASSTLDATIYKHRTLSLSEPDYEIPAVSVNTGSDLPLSEQGASNIAYIDSLLELVVRAVVVDVDEDTVKLALFIQRVEIHKVLMAGDRLQGLGTFVIDTRYGGAEAPEIVAGTERLAGHIDTRWFIHYRMNISDPS